MRQRWPGALAVVLGLLALTGCSYEGQEAQDDLRAILGALHDAELVFDSERCVEPGSEEFTVDWRLHVEVDAEGAEVAAALDGLFDIDEHDGGWLVQRPRFGGFEGTVSPDGTTELVARGVGALSYTTGWVGEFPTPCEGAVFPEPSERRIDPYVDAGIRTVPLWAHKTAEGAREGEADVTGKIAVSASRDCVFLMRDGGAHPVIWPHGTELAETDPLTIRLPDGRLVHAGSSVAGTGGYTPVERFPLDIPDDCLDASREVAWFNPTDHVRVTWDATGP